MEWHIMNGVGLTGSITDFGCMIDGSYQVSDDCLENLNLVLDQLLDDDPVQRPVRKQLATSRVIEQELVPLLTDIEDDPSVFGLAVRLCVNLTQPVECLQFNGGSDQGVSSSSWFYDVQKLLIDAKRAFTDIKCIKSVLNEIKKIFEDAGEYDLVQEDCEMINQCLLLIRNLLHIQDPQQASLSDIHIIFLKHLFQAGMDEVMMTLLNTKQKEYWGVTVVQLISLIYKDLVSEILLTFEDASSCGEESCDSSNCSQCEAAMDRCPLDPSFTPPASKQGSPSDSLRSSKCNSPLGFGPLDDATIIDSSFDDDAAFVPTVPHSARSCSPPCTLFENECEVSNDPTEQSGEQCLPTEGMEEGKGSDTRGISVDFTKSQSDDSFQAASNSSKTRTTSSGVNSMEDIGSHLTDFTTHFLQNGFSSLVHILKKNVVTHTGSNPPLDDSYFLWSVAFFLKFARRKEIEFEKIKDVFTTEVFGFLVYEAVANSEEVIDLYNNNQTATLSMRRLHLSVSALRELLKTMSFHKEKGLQEEEAAYLDQLQRDLANMSDIRQVFLWLIRMYTPGCHSHLYLRDVIVTNHYFLLLLEEWISRDLCRNPSVGMLSHVKQFASNQVMNQYGCLLQNFIRNDHHVNNCVFTMMHHVAGDCAQPDTLLQANILNTFLQIWDAEIPITQEMNDLMEYVAQKLFKSAEENPVSCAIRLFNESDNDQELLFPGETDMVNEFSAWTSEEEDKLVMWYSQLNSSQDMINKLVKKFTDNGMKKSKLEVVNQLYQLGMLAYEELTDFLQDNDLAMLKLEPEQKQKEDEACERNLIFMELSEMKEEKFLSYCLKTIRTEGLGEQLGFLQKSLLEAAYAKIDEHYFKKEHVEEPVARYFNLKRRPIPIVFFNESQEKIRNSIYMMALIQYIGLEWEDESPWTYPRIPCDFTVHDLVAKAELLGDVREDIKFDKRSVPIEKEPMTAMKEEMTSVDSGNMEIRRARPMEKMVPKVGWMNMIQQFNMATTQGSGEVTLVGVAAGKGTPSIMELE